MINYKQLGEANLARPKNAPIVVIDSGLGGVVTAQRIFNAMPSENVIVFTDHMFSPYGEKSKKEMEKRSTIITRNIKLLNPKAVVLACNTLDSLAGDQIDTLLGNIPLYRVVTTTALKAIKTSKTKQMGLIATPATINSHTYMHAIVGFDPQTHLYGMECPTLAYAIQNNDNLKEEIESSVMVFKDIDIDTLVLGCTHYTKIMPILTKLFPDVNIVDSSKVLADYVVEDLQVRQLHAKANLGRFAVMTTSSDEKYMDMLSKNLKNIDYKFYDESEIVPESEVIDEDTNN